MTIRKTALEAARLVCEKTSAPLGFSSKELLKIVPKEILDKEFKEIDPVKLTARLEKMCDEKVNELAQMLGFKKGWRKRKKDRERLGQLTDYKTETGLESLPESQQKKAREFYFLSNLAIRIIHA